MDLGSLEVQIFVSLALVLGALFVALVCDFLKGNNEVLRERNIELIVRREEQRQRGNPGTAVREKGNTPARSRRQPPAPAAAKPQGRVPARSSSVQSSSWASEEELKRLAETAAKNRTRAKENSAPEPQPLRSGFSSPPRQILLQPKVTPISGAVPEPDIEPETAESFARADNQAEMERTPPQVERPEHVTEVALPSGLRDSAVLSRLLEKPEPFSGIVIAIGITNLEGIREGRQGQEDETPDELISSVAALVESLLTPRDCACRLSEGQFILMLPGQSGASGQRRLHSVSQRLWDFQLRSVGVVSIMFSWGAAEVSGEPLAEAVASAKERMRETKRNRETPPSGIHGYRPRIAGV